MSSLSRLFTSRGRIVVSIFDILIRKTSRLLNETRLSGVVVYSVQSASSFEAAASMLEAIQRLKVPFYLPVLLIGNQNDLEYQRQVLPYSCSNFCKKREHLHISMLIGTS